MLYDIYQAQADFINPLRHAARHGGRLLRAVTPDLPYGVPFQYFNAALEVFGQSGVTHNRPDYRIQQLLQGNDLVAVHEEVVASTPFANLLHFRKDSGRPQPKLLVVAPLSGHFATLLRNTIEVLLRDHDVYVTDWKNARDIPVSAGLFGFDDYVEHIIKFLEHLGPRCHVIGVCQPTVAVLAAVSLMAEANNPATPRSMTLMAGPIDTRRNPTRVNLLAQSKDISWFEKNLIGVVPWRYKGAGRRVYPGFMQLTAFVSMNLDKHLNAHIRQYRSIASKDQQSSETHRVFYDEYLAVMDLCAEFFLETVDKVFIHQRLATGELTYRGRKVKPSAIRKTLLLTVEGERDDICGLGQTSAALDLCSGLKPAFKRHHVQTAVGHYGVFSGRRWENEIYPLVRETIEAAA